MQHRTFIKVTMLALLVFTASQALSRDVNIEKYRALAQTATSVRIASASVITEKWDKPTNWRRIERMVREAAAEGGADVVVTPEGALDGYVINEVNQEKDSERRAELKRKFFQLGEPLEGPYIGKACNLADELDIFLVLGFLELRGQSLFNSAVLIDPDGEVIGRYSKTHFAQGYRVNPDFYRPGDDYPVFDTPFGKAAILICYDRQLPEPARIMALKGAQVLFVPSFGSWTDPGGWNTNLLRTRAYENGFPLVFCHPYQSLLIDRQGEVKAVGRSGEIAYFEIDTSPEHYEGRFANRRPATYLPLTAENPSK